jgi:DMSO reductase anchor subunit
VQACPNEAIRITVVEQAKVRGKYRQLSSFNFHRSTSSPAVNAFLPDSPNPAITLPTTRYVSQRTLPADLAADDSHELKPALAHPPLTFLLILSQLGVGLTLLNLLTGGRSRPQAAAALLVTLIAVIVGTLHLGQPLKAWRSFLGWRKSWFSRELIAFGAFLAALGAHVALLHPFSALCAALAGLTAVACSAMIYVDTRRPFWNAPMTFGKFISTTLLLGGATTLALGGPAVALIAVLVGTVTKLASENRIFRFLVNEQDPHLSALNKTALLLTGRFGFVSRVRVLCALVGGIVLPLAMVLSDQAGFAFSIAALALCLAGELIERHLFFVAEVAPRMPGGAAA